MGMPALGGNDVPRPSVVPAHDHLRRSPDISPRNFWLLLCGVLVLASAAACTSELCATRLADVDLQYMDEDGNSQLHLAVWNDDLPTIQCILTAGASIEAQSNQGWTPLHAAALEGHVEATQALLVAGAQVDETDADGTTPLYMAALTGNTDVADLLIASCAQVDTRDIDGWTPLPWEGHAEVAESLLAAGSNPEAKTTAGSTPMPLASQQGHLDLVTILISQVRQEID